MFIQTKVDALVRLVGAASNDPTRYYLGGVNVRTRRGTEGVVLEATNGHIMAIEHDFGGERDAAEGSAIVSAQTIKEIARVAKDAAKRLKLLRDELRVRVDAKSFALYYFDKNAGRVPASSVLGLPDMSGCFIDGTFPDCERVIPRIDPKQATNPCDAYNAGYVDTLAKTARRVPPKAPGNCAILYSSGIGSPALMRVSGAPHWFGVIMPVRVDGDPDPAPAWFFGEPAKRKAAA